MLNAIILRVIMMNVNTLSIVMLNVVMPRLYTEYCYAERGLCRYAECRSDAETEHFCSSDHNDKRSSLLCRAWECARNFLYQIGPKRERFSCSIVRQVSLVKHFMQTRKIGRKSCSA
jgi:hypothetical protein